MQSLKTKRQIEKLERQNKVLSKRLVEVETRTAWLYSQLKSGMSDVITNACHRIAEQELSAEIIPAEQSVDEQLKDALKGAEL